MAYELFCDSFDTQTFSTNGSLFTGRWSLSTFTSAANLSSAAGAGRRSTSSLRITAASSSWGYATRGILASTHVVLGFWYRLTSGLGVLECFFRKGANTLVTVGANGSGGLSVTLAGQTYSSVKSLPVDCYIEVGLVVGNSGSLEVRVNGDSEGWLNLTGVDTQPGSDTDIDSVRFQFRGNSSGTADFDDLYITYGNELKWLGDIRVDAIPINANATPQDWTPDTGEAYQRLTQSAGYIQSATVGAESLFELADYAVNTVAIHGVVVNATALKSDSGTRSFAIETKSGDTVSVGATNALGTTSQEFRQTWLTDPNTGAAWTGAALNALKAGVKLVE